MWGCSHLGRRGFSLVELLVAMTVTLGIGAMTFQLFRQNSMVFRDQDTIMDAEQGARAAVSEIADELRMAGQGVPVFSAAFDETVVDGVTSIMAGSGPARINLRSGRSNVESTILSPAPLALRPDTTDTVMVMDASVFSSVIGSTPSGKTAYIWGATENGWSWARTSILAIASKANTVSLTPIEIGGSNTTLQFQGAAAITLEEAVTIYFDPSTRSIRRATATDLSDPVAPVWAPANELVTNVTALTFRYYDRAGAPISTDTTVGRASIFRIEFELTVEVEHALSNGAKPAYTFSSVVVPHNLRIP